MNLLVLDMDGVLLDCRSSWQELHKMIGVDNNRNRELYYSNSISYCEFMKKDLMLWIDLFHVLKASYIYELGLKIKRMDGLGELHNWIKKNTDVKVIIVTGGLDLVARPFVGYIAEQAFANHLEIDDAGNLTGECKVVSNPYTKGETLSNYVKSIKNQKFEKIISVGDGEVDISMFNVSDISIAFNPENEKVEKASMYVIKEKNLILLVELLNKIV
ncbi:MAG: HAD-IB family phosphatase [Thermoplasmata archaeon]